MLHTQETPGKMEMAAYQAEITPSRGDTSVNLAFVASGFILFGS